MKQTSLKKRLIEASNILFGFKKNARKNKIVVKEIDPVYLLTTYIAGFQFYNGKLVEKFFTKGAKLSLNIQEDNFYDENAIEVLFSGFKLGYIPRNNNPILANLSRYGKQLYAEITDFYPEIKSPERIACKVYMK
ncbi:MAG: HIRAN domain-containing protein [Bacteroidales bacterium]|nr:HIRAN domain-containing protein [Bacteroidales bacterium]